MLSLFRDVKLMAREMPIVLACALLAVVFGMGAHGAVYCQADAPRLRLVADHRAVQASTADRAASVACDDIIPGFTVVVGLKEYNVRLTVPVDGVSSLVDAAQLRLSEAWSHCQQSVA